MKAFPGCQKFLHPWEVLPTTHSARQYIVKIDSDEQRMPMKKFFIGVFTLSLMTGSALAHTFVCGSDMIESKKHGYIYVPNEDEVVSIDISTRFDNKNDEKTSHIMYQIKIGEEIIQRKAYFHKREARANDAGYLNSFDEEYFIKITDEIGNSKISLSLNVLDTSLRGKITNRDGKEDLRLLKNCSEHVLKSIK